MSDTADFDQIHAHALELSRIAVDANVAYNKRRFAYPGSGLDQSDEVPELAATAAATNEALLTYLGEHRNALGACEHWSIEYWCIDATDPPTELDRETLSYPDAPEL